MPQRYVIGTSTKVDLGDFKLPESLSDEYFKKNKKSTKRAVKRKAGEDIFASKKEVRFSSRPSDLSDDYTHRKLKVLSTR